MKYTNRANIERLTKQWDAGILKNCYCLIFSNIYGFKIIWNNETGEAQNLKGDALILKGYFVVLAVYETEEQAKKHFNDFIKFMD